MQVRFYIRICFCLQSYLATLWSSTRMGLAWWWKNERIEEWKTTYTFDQGYKWSKKWFCFIAVSHFSICPRLDQSLDISCLTVCFRWLIENGEAVLYLYEIQLISSACRMGLGTKLMKLVEKMASKTRMSKVVLTVLVGNTAAIEFYRKLGYTNNEKMPGKCSYRILSKNVKSNPEMELKYTA